MVSIKIRANFLRCQAIWLLFLQSSSCCWESYWTYPKPLDNAHLQFAHQNIHTIIWGIFKAFHCFWVDHWDNVLSFIVACLLDDNVSKWSLHLAVIFSFSPNHQIKATNKCNQCPKWKSWWQNAVEKVAAVKILLFIPSTMALVLSTAQEMSGAQCLVIPGNRKEAKVSLFLHSIL